MYEQAPSQYNKKQKVAHWIGWHLAIFFFWICLSIIFIFSFYIITELNSK